MKKLSPEEIVEYFTDAFGEKVKSTRIEKRTAGKEKKEFVNVWLTIERDILTKVVTHLSEIQFPHLAIISGNDIDESIFLNYHFSLYYGERLQEISINFTLELPKSDPTVESICHLIPGALITEREIQEMFGVTVKNIPDDRRIFLPKEIPEGVYPWRKDEKGPQKIVRDMYD
jgi:membrane-bound hydrogenase subunit beta